MMDKNIRIYGEEIKKGSIKVISSKIIKRNKYGFWVLIDGKKIFIHYSETLNESIFEDETGE